MAFSSRSAASVSSRFLSTAQRLSPTFLPFPSGVDGLTEEWCDFTLTASWSISPDTKVLRFELPSPIVSLAKLSVPSGVKVRATMARCGTVLDKSYSPISVPDAEGHVDLLVKEYPSSDAAGGGLGAHLCELHVGSSASMRLKAPRNWGGQAAAAAGLSRNRFHEIVLIGNGTGVAPLYQIARAVLADPREETKLRFISAHRTTTDYLLVDELEEFAARFPQRFVAHAALSCEEHGDGSSCRLDRTRLAEWLPPAPSSVREEEEEEPPTLAFVVCGTDGFLDDVCGGHVRVAVPGEVKKKKLQGKLGGHLAALGFDDERCVLLKL